MMRELERKVVGEMIYRIAEDDNRCLHHQYKFADESLNPYYNDGWTTDYESFCCITVNKPYPYTAPSSYYMKRAQGYSIEEALNQRCYYENYNGKRKK